MSPPALRVCARACVYVCRLLSDQAPKCVNPPKCAVQIPAGSHWKVIFEGYGSEKERKW